MKTELGLLQLLLWATFYFLQAFEQLKRTTENSVHMCFHGWWRCRAEMVPLSKRISETIKERRGEFVDWYAFTITLVMLIGRASGASVFFSCIRCSAASHATGGLQAARGSIVRKVGGERKIVFFFCFFLVFPCWEPFEHNGGSSSLPGLRGEVINLSQVLHGWAFQVVRQLDPHS